MNTTIVPCEGDGCEGVSPTVSAPRVGASRAAGAIASSADIRSPAVASRRSYSRAASFVTSSARSRARLNLHVEALLRRQVGAIGFHRRSRDHVDHSAPLECVHGRCPAVVEVAGLRSVPPEIQISSVFKPRGKAVGPNGDDLGGPAVHQSEVLVVAGPGHTVARAKLEGLSCV